MACPDRLSQWFQEVSTAFEHLSKPQIWGLVLWSAGIALTRSAGIVQISALLAMILHQQEQSVFQRLREWYLNANQKSGCKQGRKRRKLDVTTCFAPLLRWVVRQSRCQQQLVLVLDATSLRKCWTALAVSVVIRGSAIPVAWKVVEGSEKGFWRPHWEGLLTQLQGSVPSSWQVLVLADQGLYAQWLFELIRTCGWHPFLRVNQAIKARAVETEEFVWVKQGVPRPGISWKGAVECFVSKASRLRATFQDPWIVLTDLPVEQAEASWYGMRTWIEGGFKDFKRGGWGWHHSKMSDAHEVERIWLAMVVAQVWMVSLGCQAEHEQSPEGIHSSASARADTPSQRSGGSVLSPGIVDTLLLDIYGTTEEEINQAKQLLVSRIPMKRIGQPEDVANTAFFLASDDSGFITGHELLVDGGAIELGSTQLR